MLLCVSMWGDFSSCENVQVLNTSDPNIKSYKLMCELTPHPTIWINIKITFYSREYNNFYWFFSLDLTRKFLCSLVVQIIKKIFKCVIFGLSSPDQRKLTFTTERDLSWSDQLVLRKCAEIRVSDKFASPQTTCDID